jgi:hypothetical protein
VFNVSREKEGGEKTKEKEKGGPKREPPAQKKKKTERERVSKKKSLNKLETEAHEKDLVFVVFSFARTFKGDSTRVTKKR